MQQEPWAWRAPPGPRHNAHLMPDWLCPHDQLSLTTQLSPSILLRSPPSVMCCCRFTQFLTRSKQVEFQDDFSAVTTAEAIEGTKLLRQEVDNHGRGLEIGLTILPAQGQERRPLP